MMRFYCREKKWWRWKGGVLGLYIYLMAPQPSYYLRQQGTVRKRNPDQQSLDAESRKGFLEHHFSLVGWEWERSIGTNHVASTKCHRIMWALASMIKNAQFIAKPFLLNHEFWLMIWWAGEPRLRNHWNSLAKAPVVWLASAYWVSVKVSKNQSNSVSDVSLFL